MQVRAMSRVSARPKSKSTNPDSNCVSVALWWNQHLAPGTGRLPRGETSVDVWLHVHHFAGTESLFTGRGHRDDGAPPATVYRQHPWALLPALCRRFHSWDRLGDRCRCRCGCGRRCWCRCGRRCWCRIRCIRTRHLGAGFATPGRPYRPVFHTISKRLHMLVGFPRLAG